MRFGEKLKQIIKGKYRTVSDCAEKLDINYSQLSQYLNGRQISIEFLHKVIEEFKDTDLNWLLREDYEVSYIAQEAHVVYKKPMKNEEIITKMEQLLGELKSQLPQ